MSLKILVTGASGFIASHTILELLDHGYKVRGTIRDINRAENLRKVLSVYSSKASEVEFVEATLTDPDCWHVAAAGCDGIFHIASPIAIKQPKDPNELIKPATGGS